MVRCADKCQPKARSLPDCGNPLPLWSISLAFKKRQRAVAVQNLAEKACLWSKGAHDLVSKAHAFNSLKKRLFLNPRNTAFVAQVFQPAGSRDFPVPCSKEPAAGKPPEPADRNVRATFKCVSPACSAPRWKEMSVLSTTGLFLLDLSRFSSSIARSNHQHHSNAPAGDY